MTSLHVFGHWTVEPKPDTVKELVGGIGKSTHKISRKIQREFVLRWASVPSSTSIPTGEGEDDAGAGDVILGEGDVALRLDRRDVSKSLSCYLCSTS